MTAYAIARLDALLVQPSLTSAEQDEMLTLWFAWLATVPEMAA